MSNQQPPWLGTITPVRPDEAGRVICFSNALKYTALIIFVQCGYLLLPLTFFVSRHPLFALVVLLSMFVWCFTVIAMAFIYPEWPMNLLLCRHLRRRIGERDNEWENLRVVELVPRERWQKLALETATDLMTIKISDSGIQLNGDHNRYDFPSESILGAKVESARPSGYLCQIHFVVVYVRTTEGGQEIPISYRDHRWGSLRSSCRLNAAYELASQIQTIARGADFQSPYNADRSIQQPQSENPYAPPAYAEQ